MEQRRAHDIRTPAYLVAVPDCVRRCHWCMLAVIDAGCRHRLTDTADVCRVRLPSILYDNATISARRQYRKEQTVRHDVRHLQERAVF